MNSKFTSLCNLVLENMERTLREDAAEPVYAVPASVDRDGLTGVQKVVADFTDTKPATVDEIIDVIKRNGENPDDTAGAENAFRDLFDNGFIEPVEEGEMGGDTEAEPDAAELGEEPVIDDTVPAEEDEEEEAEATKPLVSSTPAAPAEEDDAGLDDEENTFTPAGVKSQIDSDEEDKLEDDEDDTPVSELIKREKQNDAKKQAQSEKLMRYILKQRGKSPEEIDAAMNNYKSRKVAGL